MKGFGSRKKIKNTTKLALLIAFILVYIVAKMLGTDEKQNMENIEDELDFLFSDEVFEGYRIIEVDGGDLSGDRQSMVAVDVGYGDREYWAFTNEHGQLVRVIAKEIILQDESRERVTSAGRYYPDEAAVSGTELKEYDQGHVIADSLGGVANAYNITPQHYVLNRHGDQAYMEYAIRGAGGASDFVCIITYPNETTQIPSHYSIIYKIDGNLISEEFDNKDPEKQ